MIEDLEKLFPALQESGFKITSPQDDTYNCLAWAAGDSNRYWWPADPDGSHWPNGSPREETLEAFQAAFATLGYAVCASEELEEGCEKVALFVDDRGLPKHAARQLSNGRWTSKLGLLEDIEHDLHALEGAEYGTVVLVLKRPLAQPS